MLTSHDVIPGLGMLSLIFFISFRLYFLLEKLIQSDIKSSVAFGLTVAGKKIENFPIFIPNFLRSYLDFWSSNFISLSILSLFISHNSSVSRYAIHFAPGYIISVLVKEKISFRVDDI